MALSIPTITLNDGRAMPLLGLGVYKATAPGEVEGAIATALDLGYRLIDTASAYKNEEGVGRGSVLLLFHGKNFYHNKIMEYCTADRRY